MEPNREGLNYVPMLTQSLTPPSSARSRISLNRNRQLLKADCLERNLTTVTTKYLPFSRAQRSVVFYNGNYEGDSSMFPGKIYELEHLSLVDSESEEEEFSGQATHMATAQAEGVIQKTISIISHLMEFLLVKFLKPTMSAKILGHFERFKQSSMCHWLTKFFELFSQALSYGFCLALICIKNLAALSRFFWRQRVIFHNLLRRLLWRLTLAKCSERWLFLYVLLSLPILFALSLIGFIISMCGGLKDALHYGTHKI